MPILKYGIYTSRESVRWTQATRDYLTKQFEKAQEEATGLIEKELKQTDFLLWIEACKSISHFSHRSNSVIGRLSKIVELNTLKPSFGTTKIKFEGAAGLFDGFKTVTNTKFLDKDKKYRVKRDTSLGWASIKTDALYFKTTTATRHKDCYISDQHNGVFTSITPMEDSEFETLAEHLITTKKLMFSKKQAWIASKVEKRDKLIKLLKASSRFQDYDQIDVPDDYKANLSKIEEGADVDASTGQAIVRISDADRRKLEEKVVYSTFVDRYMPYNSEEGETYQRSKREDKFENIKNYKGKLFYGSTKDMSKLQFACHLIDHDMVQAGMTDYEKFDNEQYRILLVAANNFKHFKPYHSHIDDFFGKVDLIKDEKDQVVGSQIVMENAVVQWNTTRQMSQYMGELAFMKNFSIFDEDVANDYIETAKYVKRFNSNLSPYYNSRLGMSEHYADFVKFLDGLEEVQKAVMNGEKGEDLATTVKSLDLPEGLTGSLSVNTKELEQLEKLRGYASTVRHLLNAIPLLTEFHSREIPMELSQEIRKYLDFKKVSYKVEEVNK